MMSKAHIIPEASVFDCYPVGPTVISKDDYMPKSVKALPAYFLNPFLMGNACIMVSYFNVGIVWYFLATPVSYYLITTLSVSSTQFAAYNGLISIPWSLKFVFGMISDGVPILRYRRKSWFIIGWLGFVAVNLWLAFTGPPGIDMTIGMMFFMSILYLMSDVCTDCLVVDRARYESDDIKGSLQTSGYTIRAFGSVIGALLGALLYNTATWGWGLTINQCFLLSALIPLITIVPVIPALEELTSSLVVPNFTQQFACLWDVMQLRAMYQPMTFIFIYGIFQIPNGAWTNFLIDGLGFTDFEYGMLTVVGTVLTWIGMVIYKEFFFETSWRNIYIYTTIIVAFFSLLQIILILRLNVAVGIPDFWFALGDTAATMFVAAIQYMPGCIAFAMICPEGNEGLVYSMLTTIWNLSYTVAQDLSSGMTLIWDVSNETIQGGDYTGVLYLAILTSLLQLVPLALVWMLPDTKAEQKALLESNERSALYGGLLLGTSVFCLVATITISIVLIWFPIEPDYS